MKPFDKLMALSSQMHLEPAEDVNCPELRTSKVRGGMISKAVIPGGKQITLLKTLLTSACERNCYYCPFRAGRNYRRITFKPQKMVETFIQLHQAGVVEGIFLSSGIVGGGARTQDQLLVTAEILRQKYSYLGYLHLKIMPGAERDQVERAMQLANRVSINLEAPNPYRLTRLAPRKGFFDELLKPLHWIDEIRKTVSPHKSWNGRWSSSVTQFVVGAAGENDLEILSTSEHLYRQFGLSRTYYSAFNPIPDTPLENLTPESPQREIRLYQSSYLLRDYGFTLEELPFDRKGNLPANVDPKLAWAQTYLLEQPIEINQANRRELLHIPGIGPKGARAILNARKHGRLRDLMDLHKIGVNLSRASPFVLLNGKRPVRQLTFW